MLHLLTLALAPSLVPQAATTGWKQPPPEVVAIVDAPSPPAVLPSPDGQRLALVERPELPPLSEVARPWVGLAGARIDAATNAHLRIGHSTGLSLRGLGAEAPQVVALPAGARLGDVRWSHTSRRLAFTLTRDDGVDLYVVDCTAAAEELVPRRVAQGLNGVFGDGFDWMPDGERLLVQLVDGERGERPERPLVPLGPSVQETQGTSTPVRTYQDLLTDPHDEALFEWLGATRLVLVDASDGSASDVGARGLIAAVDVSPDGRHVLVETLERPFSYLQPAFAFPTRVELWRAEGGLERVLARLPAQENVPIQGVPTGPRAHAWQQSAPATLVWLEALDGGDPRQAADWRDQWYALAAPFEGEARPLLRTQHRARGLVWLRDGRHVLAGDFDRDRRWTRTGLYDLEAPEEPLRWLDDRSVNDRYGDPGAVQTELDERGARVVRQDGPWIYRAGAGDAPGGARPFLDRQRLDDATTERLWRCAPGSYESLELVQASASEQKPRILTVYETPDEVPNWRLRDLERDTIQALTDFEDPTPQLRGITKELVTYARADGVELSATLYLPAGHEAGTRLPLVVWAYPLEFNDPATAGQVRGSPHRFTRIGGTSHLLWLTQGYAVMDNATMPIVGDPETMNDTFVEQVVASAQAAIDKAVELGVADATRVGVGGHSYGAFMTANLLAHCDLFKAGVARSGAYNRTLTPFGFQSERRTLWEAPEAYARVSPFFHAEKIDEPLLLIHGEKDSNSGTFPMQSERLFAAIKGNGGHARLVLLPHEDHGYRARESTLHALAEMIEWFDTHVKAPVPVEATYGAR
jgi:dipeptidyl aminopeptidase/acylaminoacyl peptidase